MVRAASVEQAACRLASESRSLLGLPQDAAGCSQAWIQHLPEPPTPLQFARHVARHVPLLIDRCMEGRDCSTLWKDSQYISDAMGPDRRVQVALTPNGRADDVHTRDDNLEEDVFVLPHETYIPFHELLASLRAAAMDPAATSIPYLQSQNSNLTSGAESGDFSPLLKDVADKDGKTSLHWADEALGHKLEATNLWIGTSKSYTSMHRDHYENLFTVLRGTKIFTLYPPCEAYFLCDDRPYEVRQWSPPEADKQKWTVEPCDCPPTPWIPIDPTSPPTSTRNAHYPRFAKALPPLVCEVQEGQTFYLPAGWYHHVAQRGDEEGLCISMNWWYESEFAFGDRWALEEFVKEIGQLSREECIDH